MPISKEEAEGYLGKEVCVHWANPDGTPGGMSGIGEKITPDAKGELVFEVDYGYGIYLSDVTAIHPNVDCPDLWKSPLSERLRFHHGAHWQYYHAKVLENVLGEYMAVYGQALEAHGITLGPQQVEADRMARKVLGREAQNNG